MNDTQRYVRVTLTVEQRDYLTNLLYELSAIPYQLRDDVLTALVEGDEFE